jgi:hypothetical protein
MSTPTKTPNRGEVRTIRDSQGRKVAVVDTRTGTVTVRQRGEAVEFNARTGQVRQG